MGRAVKAIFEYLLLLSLKLKLLYPRSFGMGTMETSVMACKMTQLQK